MGEPAWPLSVLQVQHKHVGLLRCVDQRRSRISYYLLLFNYFVLTYLNNANRHIGFANDLHAAELCVNPETAANSLTAHAEIVGHWTRERDIQISVPEQFVNL